VHDTRTAKHPLFQNVNSVSMEDSYKAECVTLKPG